MLINIKTAAPVRKITGKIKLCLRPIKLITGNLMVVTLTRSDFWYCTHPLFGIGTNLTNDLGYPPLQIVIKMTECNGQPVAKITDNPDKITYKNFLYLTQLKKAFKIEYLFST